MLRSTLPRLFVGLALAAALRADDSSASPRVIAHGERINLADHLVPGKTVIFDFFSAYSAPCPCEPCVALENPLAALQAANPKLVVVRVDINREGVTQVDWNSPVARQFGLRRLPHFKIYGPDGGLVAEDQPRENAAPARRQVHDLIVAVADG